MSTCAKVLAIAKAEVGYREGFSAGHWNNVEKYAAQVPGLEWANGQPWCAVFVSWCALKAGAAELYPRTASVAAAMAWWKKAGRFSEYPAIGAQVIYGGGEHTGLVLDFDAHTITTIEGNTNDSGSAEGNGVYIKRRNRTDPYVTGYGYPRFPEGIHSADPAYASPAAHPLHPYIRAAVNAPAGAARRAAMEQLAQHGAPAAAARARAWLRADKNKAAALAALAKVVHS